MIIPPRVIILGSAFDVSVVSLDDPSDVGITDVCARTIKISSDIPEDVQVETFYHECTHAMLALSGVGHTLEEDQEEAVAQSVGFALMHFLTKNNGALPVLEAV